MKKITLLILTLFCGFSHAQVTVGTGQSTSQFNQAPINPYYGYSYAQSIYLASDINATGNITAITFEMSDSDAINNSDDNIDFWIGHTTKTSFDNASDWVDVNTLTQVMADGSLTKSGTTITFTFSTPFAYNGTDNLIIAVDANETNYDTSADRIISTTTSDDVSLFYRSDTVNPDSVSPPSGTLLSAYGNATFIGIVQTCPPPSNLTATNITSSGADLGWVENGSASLYNVEVVIAGATPTGTATDTGVVNGFTKMGLASGTDYDFYVQADCTGGDLSSWAGPFTFMTLVTCPVPSDLTATNITTTTADLGWTENGTASTYNVEVVPGGDTPTGSATDSVVANGFTKTGLSPSSNYDFYVQAICSSSDVSSWAGPFSFTTNCAAVSDINENFDSYGTSQDPLCWIENLGGSSGYMYTSSSDVNSGSRALRSGNISTINAVHYIVLPEVDNLAANTHWLNFFMENSVATSVAVGTMTDPMDANTFTLAETLPGSLTMFNHKIEIISTNADTYVALQVTYSSSYNYVSIDDVIWEPKPTCIAPNDLMASNITATTADLGWVGNGSASLYNVEVVTSGTTPNGTATDTGVANGFTKMGLTSDTEYDYYVQADCGTGDLSSWAGPFTFKTACASFTPEYDADMSSNVPDCWSEAGSGDLTSGPSDFGTSLWTTGNFNNGTPSNRINLYINNREDWIISPIFDLSGAAPSELNVTVALTNTSTSGVEPFGSDDLVALVMSTDGGNTWTSLQSWEQGTEPSDTGDQITYDLSAITGNVQFAFYGTDGSVNDTEDVYFHVGQFRVRETPSCPEPSGIMATNLTTTSADISWTTNGSATVYNVEIVPAGTSPSGTATDVGVANGFTKTGLSLDNSYDVYVQADCGNGDTSIWVGPETFDIEYCESTPSSNDGSGISSLELNGTSFTSGGDIFYEDFTGTPVDLNQDATVPASVTFATGYTYNTNIWIDFNDDLVFDASELLFSGQSLADNPTTLDTSFSLSATAALGQHRMRIGTADSGQASPNPCYEGTYGVTIDMTVNILPAGIANDDCDGAEMLTLGTTVNADNTGATDSGMTGCLTGTISDVWYSFVAPISGEVDITVTGAGFQYELFSGADCTALTSVSCNTSNNGGLTASSTYFIRINDDGTGANRAPGAFSILVEEASLSTNDIDTQAAFSYYPNPVKNTLTLNAVSNTIDSVSVFNVLGQQVLAAQPKVLNSNLDMSNLQDGAYFVRVTIANTTQTIKVIKH